MKDIALAVREEVGEGDEEQAFGGVVDAMTHDDDGADDGADDDEGVGDVQVGGGSGGKSGGRTTTWDGYPAWAFKGGGKGRPGQVDRFGGVYVEGGYTYQGEFWSFGTHLYIHNVCLK